MNNELIDLEGEIWRDIEGYKGLYQVSNKGRVKSLNYKHTGKEKLLKPGIGDVCGHLLVTLYKNGVRTNKWVHRLVAEAFLPRIKECNCVDHIDTVPTNNYVENLRWTTPKENSNNPLTIIHYRDAQRNIMTPVYCYETDTIYQSTMDVEHQLNVHSSSVSRCCRGKRKQTGGFHFCYADEISDTYELFLH